MRRTATILAATLALAIALGGAASAQATRPVDWNTVTTSAFTLVNPCNGEEILFGGEYHQRTLTVEDAAGGFHHLNHGNTRNVTGVGLASGDRYGFVNVGTINDVGGPGRPHVYDYDSVTYKVVGRGPSPDFLWHIVEHNVYDADGGLVRERYDSRFECVG